MDWKYILLILKVKSIVKLFYLYNIFKCTTSININVILDNILYITDIDNDIVTFFKKSNNIFNIILKYNT